MCDSNQPSNKTVGPMVTCVININLKTASFFTFQTITIDLGGQIYTMTTLATDLFIVNLYKQGYLIILRGEVKFFLLISGFAAVFATVCHDAVMTPADGESLHINVYHTCSTLLITCMHQF